jgi:serine/threonine-protein kinase
MTPSPNCPDAGALRELLDNNLPDREQENLAAHLETCVDCHQTLENLAAGDRSWARLPEQLGQPRPGLESETALQQAMRQLAEQGTHTLPPRDEANADDLSFLGPPTRPGALGRLGPYEVLEVIGRGGMGIVLKAHDEALNRIVAIKILAPHLGANETSRKRFIREAQAAAAVSHEHVVTIHAVDPAPRLPYLVMQLVSGVSLEDYIRRRGAQSAVDVLRIGAQIGAGLAAAHKQGLVHRDIKPANILLENGEPRVKITDFGLARAADNVQLTQEGAIAGTPSYMSPEQARGEPVDHRSDLFSLGSVLYTLCTGQVPFRGETTLSVLMNVCEKAPRPIRDANPDIPVELEQIISRLMAKDPAHRIQTAQEVSEMFNGTLTKLPHPGPRFRMPEPAPSRPPQHPDMPVWPFVGAGIGILFVVGIALAIVAVIVVIVNNLQPQNQGQLDVALQGQVQTLKKFTTDDKVLMQDGVKKEKDHWVITAKEPRTVRLFEVANPDAEKCTVIYRAKLKTENVKGKAYLEMWCRFPGQGEFFSKGLAHPATGTTDWASHETPFFLKQGERPDLIKLNLHIEGSGTVSIKDIELMKGPLPAQ